MKIKKNKIAIAVFILVFIYLISSFKDILIKSAVTAAAGRVTGAQVRIDGFSFDLIASNIHIKGLKMYNPAGFPKEVLIDMPKIEVEYNLSALLKKKMYFPLVEIDLREVVVIKNGEGKLNVNSLKFAEEKEEPQAKRKKQKDMPMRIDVLKLNIGRVVHKDFSVGEKPSVQVYEINIKGTYKNITSATQLISLILAESLKQTAIKGARIYGVAALAGVAVLPVGVASMFIGQDTTRAEFDTNYERAYKAALEAMDDLGDIVKENRKSGYIKGKAHGGIDVTIKVSEAAADKVAISVSARKYILPKPRVAEGLLYQISQKLK